MTAETATAGPSASQSYPLLAHDPGELKQAGLSCLFAGQAEDAEALFRGGALRSPSDPDLRYRLASALMAQGKMDEAILCLADARNLHARRLLRDNFPDIAAQRDPTEMLQAAVTFYQEQQASIAGELMRPILAAYPQDVPLMNEFAMALSQMGRIEEACAIYETLVRRLGYAPEAHSYLHLLRIFQQTGPETLYNEGRRWSQLCEETAIKRPRRSPRAKGKIRIGYYAATFNRHQLGHFFLPILENHDAARFEIFCYSHGVIIDDVGKTAKGNCTFRHVGRMSDDEVCALIETDEIDILVDLWGHSHQHRLPVFARKPAPIQVSYLNYINTTGLTSFDYVLLPDDYRAPDDQRWFSEEIVSIGEIVAPYRVFDPVETSRRSPARTAGRFTFASAAHPSKIGLPVARVWAEILKRVPGSVLELRYMLYKDPVVARAMIAQFEACGVESERLVFPPQVMGQAFRETFRGFDLVLDPFPYQGMTTTMDALSMGVPVLALEGDFLAVKVAPAALRSCGLPELIADSLDDYVERAVALANDLDALDALRARVLPGFEASAFRKEAEFTHRLESVYLEMLRRHGAQAAAA